MNRDLYATLLRARAMALEARSMRHDVAPEGKALDADADLKLARDARDLLGELRAFVKLARDRR
jgi:hypothetical protein